MLDIDALNAAEGETWVWKGSNVIDLGPDEPHDVALLKLSRGGADATVVREFNLVTKEFVAEADGGFVLPEAKSSVTWKTRDVLLIGTDTGKGSLTDSGYPREVREWKRGTPLSSAECIFAGEAADVSVRAYCYYDKGATYNMLSRAMTFYTSKDYVFHNGYGAALHLVPFDFPLSPSMSHSATFIIAALFAFSLSPFLFCGLSCVTLMCWFTLWSTHAELGAQGVHRDPNPGGRRRVDLFRPVPDPAADRLGGRGPEVPRGVSPQRQGRRLDGGEARFARLALFANGEDLARALRRHEDVRAPLLLSGPFVSPSLDLAAPNFPLPPILNSLAFWVKPPHGSPLRASTEWPYYAESVFLRDGVTSRVAHGRNCAMGPGT